MGRGRKKKKKKKGQYALCLSIPFLKKQFVLSSLSTVLVEDTEEILQNITAATPSIHKAGARTHVSDWISYFSQVYLIRKLS